MRRWLALVFVATTSLVVISLVIPLAVAVRNIPREDALTKTREQSLGLISAIPRVEKRESLRGLVDQASAINNGEISLLLPDGTLIGPEFPNSPELGQAKQGLGAVVDVDGGVDVLTPGVLQDGTAVVRAFVSQQRLTRGVYRAWFVLFGLGVSMILVAVLIADRLARSMTKPIAGLAETTRSLARGNLEARVEPAGPPEIQDVGRTLNLLADRIDDLLESEREAIADLSHRLRTPITALRLNAESLRDPDEAARICLDIDGLTGAVDQLIRRARAPMAAGPSVADAVDIVRERAAFWAPLAEEQGREVAFLSNAGADPGWVAVPRDELEAMLDVLIDNVFSHTPEDTAFRIGAEVSDTRVKIRIEDAGPGIETNVERGQSGGGSTGLGLSIARKTAEENGGEVVLGRSDLGGLSVLIDLPRIFHHGPMLRPRPKMIAKDRVS